MNRPYRHRPRQPGFALVTALIFLVVLTLVAVVAIRSSGLEMKMGANATMRAQALQASELSRSLITGGPTNGSATTGGLLDAHIYNRGWPTSIGGGVPVSVFNTTIPSYLTIRDASATSAPYTGNYHADTSHAPSNWFNADLESSFPCITQLSETGASCPSPLSSSPQMVVDAEYHDDTTNTAHQYLDISAMLAVYKLRTDLDTGSGNAMVAGYEGSGRAAAASGGSMFFYLLTRGQDQYSSPQARYDTSAQYRFVIRN